AAPRAASPTTTIGTRSRLIEGSGCGEKSKGRQRRLTPGREDVRDEGIRDPRVCGSLDRRDGIGRGHVLRCWDLNALHFLAGCGHVGGVHDAGVSLAQLDLADDSGDTCLEALWSHLDARGR